MAIGFLIVAAIMVIKYKPAYRITLAGEELGYVENKQEFENKVNEILEEKEDATVAFVTLDQMPECEWQLISTKEQITEEQVLGKIQESTQVRYTMYAITVNDVIGQCVATMEEAEEVVEQLKKENEEIELEVSYKQMYSDEKPEVVEKEVAVAKVQSETIAGLKANNEVNYKAIAVVNGVEIASVPVSGYITSRFGSYSRLRVSSHTGLDIAATTGTPIVACSGGTVTFSGTNGSYGKLVKIDHGNGVETWYGHCSKLYVSVGQEVKAGEKIAAVGSTGNSTGPHLHLEIRINGTAVNPQKYLYK